MNMIAHLHQLQAPPQHLFSLNMDQFATNDVTPAYNQEWYAVFGTQISQKILGVNSFPASNAAGFIFIPVNQCCCGLQHLCILYYEVLQCISHVVVFFNDIAFTSSLTAIS
mmetsp:Transcript_81446/g.136338  ORF Transcript_81446/g.136338 Transcript_81446/m.136338 type:complete len:111 (-) Transcript_81446:218-550(-)